jgi:hypothetical protein
MIVGIEKKKKNEVKKHKIKINNKVNSLHIDYN